MGEPNDESASSTQHPLAPLTEGPFRRVVLVSVGKMIATAALLLVGYFLLPFDRATVTQSWLMVGVAVVALVVVDVVQLRAVAHSERPALRGLQALVVSLTLMLVVFAALYLSMAGRDPGSFNEPLDHIDSLYFTLTTLATVGYGDIAPVTNGARSVVMVQMVVNLIVIGVFVKLIGGTVNQRLSPRLESSTTSEL